MAKKFQSKKNEEVKILINYSICKVDSLGMRMCREYSVVKPRDRNGVRAVTMKINRRKYEKKQHCSDE